MTVNPASTNIIPQGI